jgi:hypothetical protein
MKDRINKNIKLQDTITPRVLRNSLTMPKLETLKINLPANKISKRLKSYQSERQPKFQSITPMNFDCAMLSPFVSQICGQKTISKAHRI